MTPFVAITLHTMFPIARCFLTDGTFRKLSPTALRTLSASFTSVAHSGSTELLVGVDTEEAGEWDVGEGATGEATGVDILPLARPTLRRLRRALHHLIEHLYL